MGKLWQYQWYESAVWKNQGIAVQEVGCKEDGGE